MPFGVAALLVLAQAVVPGTARPSVGNSTADLLVERSLALGIDFNPPVGGPSRAVAADVQALERAAPGSWLHAQIEIPDPSISEPPRALRDYLDDRREPLQAVVAALEKGTPEWDVQDDALIPHLLPWVRLHRILLAAALSYEREGDAIEAERALEASWSLGGAFARQNTLIARILGVSVERWQAGVLRKLERTPLSWIDRLATDEPWQKIADAVAAEGRIKFASELSPPDASAALRAQAMAAVAEAVRKTAPCDRDALSNENLSRLAAEVYRRSTSEEARAWETIYESMVIPSLGSTIRRSARLLVDRELTLRILELRFEKEASRDGAWPASRDLPSLVCPGASYRYRSSPERMEIRFEGSVDTPEAGVILPLEFHTAALTASEEGGMIAPP